MTPCPECGKPLPEKGDPEEAFVDVLDDDSTQKCGTHSALWILVGSAVLAAAVQTEGEKQMTEQEPKQKTFLDADAIFAKDDTVYEEIPMPEWGEDVYVKIRSLNGEEAQKFGDELQSASKANKKLAMARLIVLSCVQADGKTPLFEEKHLTLLYKKNMKGLVRIQNACLKMNGLTEDEKAEAKND